MKIIEYGEHYLNDVRILLNELEEYILSIDIDELDYILSEFYEKMALPDYKEVYERSGKCYISVEDEMVVGLIIGL